MRNNVKWSGAAVALALAAMSGSAYAVADVPGYVTTAGGQVWTTPFGQCVRTTQWSQATAEAPCDVLPVATAPMPTRVEAAQPPVAAAAPSPAPLAPVIQQVTLSSDVLFQFDKAELRPEGKQKLDELADDLKNANVQQIQALGYADPIGSEKYNQQLSEKRAQSVKDYLATKGIEADRIIAEGRGESNPVVSCENMGPLTARNRKAVQCLQPDRRVEIEVRGTRNVASSAAPTGSSAGGTTGGTTGTESPSGGTSR